VRKIAAGLNLALRSLPPSEKAVRKDLEALRDATQRYRQKLIRLGSSRLGELVEVDDPDVAELDGDPDVPVRPSSSPSDPPNWELDDPVDRLLEALDAFGERLNGVLAIKSRGGAFLSPKWPALWLLCGLAREYTGSCSARTLQRLGEAYLRPVLALHNDDARLREHVHNVIEETEQLQRKTAEDS
jgi:hypothetical protein